MWSWISFGLVVGVVTVAAAHFLLQRRLQQRALCALRWIEHALGPNGHVSGMRWLSAHQIEVPLKVVHPIFRRSHVHITLQPISRLFRKATVETLTFHADLDLVPTFSMTFGNLRLFARTQKHLSPDTEGWQVMNCKPVVLTTRLDWERDITNAVYTVLHSQRREHVEVTFRRSSPHFSATMPLEALSPDHPEPLAFLEMLREMAEGVSLKKAS
jgi:hypothetical protein